MRRPLSEYTNPEENLPSKDPFYKTNLIFNRLFDKNMMIKDGQTSMTNINGVIWVNFNQVAIKKIVKEYGPSEFLMSCGHTTVLRAGTEMGDNRINSEVNCYRCGMMYAYRSFEHEWSHIIFKSSPAMFDRFTKMYGAQYATKEVYKLIALLVNAFDDIRVNSLWGLVYPGSAGEIDAKWKELVELDPKINTDFVTWLFGVALDAEAIGKGPYDDLIPLARKATSAIRGRGAANMLLVIRWFLEQCLERLINPPPEEEDSKKEQGEDPEDSGDSGEGEAPKTRDEAVDQIMDKTSGFKRDQEHHQIDHSNYVSHIAYALQRSEEAALAKIMNVKLNDLREEIPDLQPDGARRPMDGEVEEAIKALQSPGGNETTFNQNLLSDAAAKVLIADVMPEDILPESRVVFSEEDKDHIDRMRAVFAKFIGKKITKLVDDGDEVDVQALIQYKLDGQDDNIFENEGFTKGFAYLTLCDMSSSMDGLPFSAVCMGAEVLKEALDYPFVRGHLWGFRGAIGQGSTNYVTAREKILSLTKGGEVWVYKYHKDCAGYLAKGVEARGFYENHRDTIPVSCGGMTPTHTGIHIATKYLSASVPAGMDKKIFLLTDGNPTQFATGGASLPKEALQKFVRKEINNARSKNIQVYTVILGNEITEEAALEMFGPQAFWRRVPVAQVGQALLELVLKEFVRFLRR